MTIPDTSLLSSLRRNHGLEHATLNILAQRFPRREWQVFPFREVS